MHQHIRPAYGQPDQQYHAGYCKCIANQVFYKFHLSFPSNLLYNKLVYLLLCPTGAATPKKALCFGATLCRGFFIFLHFHRRGPHCFQHSQVQF
nr:MAG TPA: hypothetical protein [Caudoviricetes sp.]